MAQLTIYLEDFILKRIEKNARKEKTSISKWVKARITQSLQNEWPPVFLKTIGSLAEVDDFARHSELRQENDVKREKL